MLFPGGGDGTAGRLRGAHVLVAIHECRQSAKLKHDLLELLLVAVNAVLVEADTFSEIELRAEEKLEWLGGDLSPPHGSPSHNTWDVFFVMDQGNGRSVKPTDPLATP